MKSINNFKYIHFIGIAGISMSALALYLSNEHPEIIITGSDINLNNCNSKIIEKLNFKNIKLINNHSKNNINDNIDLVIYNSAIKTNNVEINKCIKNNIKMISRSKLLSIIMQNYKNTICVAGTHGKTTTTSMLSNLMLDNKMKPTIMIGSFLKKINGNISIGKKDFFITEACEYKNSFLDIFPDVSIILNIDNDHLDFFKNINNIEKSFQKFCQNTKKLLIINNDDKHIKKILNNQIYNQNQKIITFGKNNNSNFYPKNIKILNGCFYFDVYHDNLLYIENLFLSCPGEHNMINALSVICLSYYFNIQIDVIKKSFKNFKNSKRRFEIIKKINNVTLISDYAHHPKEIEVTLNTAKLMNFNRVICVFQPHTYSRTITLFDEFINILNQFDIVILIDIYDARKENNIDDISSKNIVEKLNNSKYINNKEELKNFIYKITKPNDAIIFMGAGDIDELLKIF